MPVDIFYHRPRSLYYDAVDVASYLPRWLRGENPKHFFRVSVVHQQSAPELSEVLVRYKGPTQDITIVADHDVPVTYVYEGEYDGRTLSWKKDGVDKLPQAIGYPCGYCPDFFTEQASRLEELADFSEPVANDYLVEFDYFV